MINLAIKTTYAAVLCALTLLTTQAAWAAPADDAKREQRMVEVQTRLRLSDEQMSKVRPVLQDAADGQRSVLLKYGIDLEAEGGAKPNLGMREGRKLRGDLQQVQADTHKRLEAILTKQQMKEFEALQRERGDELRTRIRGGR